RRRIRDAAEAALVMLAAGSLLATVLALGGRLAWPLELLSHFKVQYAAAQALLATPLLALGRRRFAAAVAAGLVVNGAALLPLAPRLGIARAAADAPDAIAVMTVNVQARNSRAERLREILRAERPD